MRFTPNSAGAHSATVSLSSNDPDENPLSIPLSGVGYTESVGEGPVAVCGLDFDAPTGSNVSFDGSTSYHPDGLALTYAWALSPPTGSAAVLSATDVAQPELVLDVAGDYVGTLIVSDTTGQTDTCEQTIEAVSSAMIHIELSWSLSDDLDLHLLEANDGNGVQGVPRTDGDCYYANCNVASSWTSPPDWGVPTVNDDDPGMLQDDIQGLGPEIIELVAPAGPPYDGEFRIMVHDYSGSTTDTTGPNPASVSVYLAGVLVSTLPFSIDGEDTDYCVATIHWPTGNVSACSGLAGCP